MVHTGTCRQRENRIEGSGGKTGQRNVELHNYSYRARNAKQLIRWKDDKGLGGYNKLIAICQLWGGGKLAGNAEDRGGNGGGEDRERPLVAFKSNTKRRRMSVRS